jgi:coiled-coil domain-containing protein 130
MGRYVPPEQEGVISGNKLHGKHALGARANKISQGILTVRFEMPYPIWCTHCPKPMIIGQGVRFNAEKKKVGNYYSSPIYSFRMKHVACGGWIEIRTDPKNTAYVVTEGARKRDLGEDKMEEGDVMIMTAEEREAMRSNAFAALEGKVEDKKRLAYSQERLEELQELAERQWEDPYEQNKKLRNTFREGRKKREADGAVTVALQDRMSLGIDLLPANEDDATRAGFIEFGEFSSEREVAKAVSKPLFPESKPLVRQLKGSKQAKKKLKAEKVAEQRTADIVAEIRGNTRAAMDPFIPGAKSQLGQGGKLLLPGLKRKRPGPENSTPSKDPVVSSSLVDYDSD